MNKKIRFVYFDAGGGHRAAATALKAVIDAQQRPWDVQLVDLQALLTPLDVFRKVTGIKLQDIYNRLLAKGWTLGFGPGLKVMHVVIRMNHKPVVELLTRYWADERPDLVVSVVPNFNRAMYESLRKALPKVPYATILTDMADYPPHFWMEPGQEQYFVCGTEKAMAQAKALGYGEERLLPASGMILRPMFYDSMPIGQEADRAAEQAKLGLDPRKPTGLVLFGGQGSNAMLEIAERLNDRQLILICGKNESLVKQLKARGGKRPHFVEGFTQEVPKYMHLSDYFIGKPGPGSISEAVAMKLPVIVERNAWTMPQERYNTEWVTEKGAGVVLPNFKGIAGAVDEVLGSLDKYRANVERIHNRAVFEIPEMLEKILEGR